MNNLVRILLNKCAHMLPTLHAIHVPPTPATVFVWRFNTNTHMSQQKVDFISALSSSRSQLPVKICKPCTDPSMA